MSELYEAHQGQHSGCAPCFAIKIRTVQFQGIDAGQHRFTDKERTRDMDEYKKLRGQGYQPKNVFGSAEIAAMAGNKFELEHSVVMQPSLRKELDSRIEATKELFSTAPSQI